MDSFPVKACHRSSGDIRTVRSDIISEAACYKSRTAICSCPFRLSVHVLVLHFGQEHVFIKQKSRDIREPLRIYVLVLRHVPTLTTQMFLHYL